MQNSFSSSGHYEMQNQVTLQSLVNRISTLSIPAATCKRSFIINDVPSHLEVNANEQMVATVVGSLLQSIIMHTKDCCIRISAKIYGKVALVSLKESHQVNSKPFSSNLRQIQQMAEKIGGSVSVSTDQKKATTIIFSFINNYPIAA